MLSYNILSSICVFNLTNFYSFCVSGKPQFHPFTFFVRLTAAGEKERPNNKEMGECDSRAPAPLSRCRAYKGTRKQFPIERKSRAVCYKRNCNNAFIIENERRARRAKAALFPRTKNSSAHTLKEQTAFLAAHTHTHSWESKFIVFCCCDLPNLRPL